MSGKETSNGPAGTAKNLEELLGAPVLLDDENLEVYKEISERVRIAVEPHDIFEEFWIRDVVELFWQGLRLRRLKVHLLISSKSEGLQRLLDTIPSSAEYEFRRVDQYLTGDPQARASIDAALKTSGLERDAIMAQTLSAKLAEVERIDGMIMRTEARRIAILREIDRHREVRKSRPRAIAAPVEKGKSVDD